MKESAVLSTARVGGGVCLAEAEKKCVLEPNQQQKDPRADGQKEIPKEQRVSLKKS